LLKTIYLRKEMHSSHTKAHTICKSIIWQDYLPDELLKEVHLEGLQATKKQFRNNVATGEIEEVAIEPDHAVRHKYLDSAYKLKGSYAPEKSVNLDIEVKYDEKTVKLAKEFEDKLKLNL
jgi:hypothetical protein